MEGQGRSKVECGMAKDDKREELQRVRMSEDQGGLETNLQSTIIDILTNQLVCKNIASYLSLSDMKVASEVSRPFLQAIRGTRRFAQVTVLAITDGCPQNIKSTLRKSEFSWRGVKVAVTDPTNIVEDLPLVIRSAEFVSLEGRRGRPWEIVYPAVKDPAVESLLAIVLSSRDSAPQLSPFQGIQPFKLSHFQLHIRFLFTNLRSVLSSPAVQETLRNLTRLNILDTKTELFPLFINDEEADEETEPFAMNFRLLTGLPNRLKSFSLPKLYPDKNSVNRCVLSLLQTNRTTMEQLSVDRKVWSLHELGTVTFPVLKTLITIVHEEEEAETLAKFLENQRSLEELAVHSADMDECLVTSIRGRCLELKKLDLTTAYFSGDVDEWSFLGSMNRLKEFGFKILENAEAEEDEVVTNGWTLLAFLPKNQLESLSLEGIYTENYGFWSVEGGVEQTEFAVKTELLQGFRCLRTLSFLGSRDAVDDQLIQWLLKEFVSLEELELSDCRRLTDSGISGKTTAEWGRNASFADLRRLKTLQIVRCYGVTPNGVLDSCVNVPSLKSLEFTNPEGPIVEWVVMELVEQNPRLERLILDHRGYFDDLETLQAKLKKKNLRVKLSLAEEEE